MRVRTVVPVLMTVAMALGCGESATQPSEATTAASTNKPSLAPGNAQNSEQVVFSGVASLSSTFDKGSPAGFWIWCEADSENPYQGECNGAMYFYALKITRHVEGEITELDEGIYQMTVSSTRDQAIKNCILTNADEAVQGQNNTVTVSCDTPGGSATSPNAVVNVTGPPGS
jgi:pectin methylesterase-like acyl-CoA thioesterase